MLIRKNLRGSWHRERDAAKPSMASRQPGIRRQHGRQQQVTTYTITITADDDSAATTRLRLETSGDQVVLTDLHLHDGNGLSTGQLPTIDFGLLLRAITTTTPTPRSDPTPPLRSRDPSPAPTEAIQRTRTAVASKARPSGPRSAAATAAASPAAGGRPRAGTANRAAAAANKRVPAARKTSTKARAATKTRAAKTSAATSGRATRAYRRMPDDFAAVYNQTDSASAIAQHYQVPRHTANGWIRRLRQQHTSPVSR
jgi:hypothetical protein